MIAEPAICHCVKKTYCKSVRFYSKFCWTHNPSDLVLVMFREDHKGVCLSKRQGTKRESGVGGGAMMGGTALFLVMTRRLEV